LSSKADTAKGLGEGCKSFVVKILLSIGMTSFQTPPMNHCATTLKSFVHV